ncbi:MAG: hypothetical protein U0903_10550 [Planctomycetales bacterium]
MPDLSQFAELSLSDFFASIPWKRSAPTPLKQASKAGDLAALRSLLAPSESKAEQPLPTATPIREELGCFWSCTSEEISAPLRKLLDQIPASLLGSSSQKPARSGGKSRAGKAVSEAVTAWVEQQNCHPLSWQERLLWLDLEPLLRSELSNEAWGALWKKLLLQTFEPPKTKPSTNLALEALISAELDWRCGSMFQEVQGGDELRKAAATRLRKLLSEACDDEGTPSAAILSDLPRYLAPFIRAVGRGESDSPLDARHASRLRKLIHRALVFCREDGSLAPAPRTLANPRQFLERALRCCDESTADLLLPEFVPLNPRRKNKGSRISIAPSVPSPQEIHSFQSDETNVAALRSQGILPTNLVVIEHDGERPFVEFQIAGETLLQGPWTSQLRLDGKVIPIEGTWFCLCWQSDKDADYVELQCKLKNGGRVERQIVFPRQANYVLIAEAVADLPPGKIEYEVRLPLAGKFPVEEQRTTRELQMKLAHSKVRVFPLGIPQHKRDSTPAQLLVKEDAIVLRQSGQGQGIYLPLMLDWEPARSETPAQWRALTVTENLKVLKPDIASGHRLQLGKDHHFYVYRSLVRTFEPRACLGHQTRYETVTGRFALDGELIPLMLVE